MTKTAAEKQAAYRQRRADKLSEESTEEGSTLPPGADCVPPQDTEGVGALPLDPIGLPPDPLFEKLDELLNLMREIHQHIAQTFVVDSIEPPIKPTPKPVGDMTQCMRCGDKLPPTETPRLVRELCHNCVWRNR